ncbi:MAG: hypothetical protein H7Y11_02210, partial [Armatimonadetes bacterium]|nr:hypothetical protein [Anaerolineae bacterium]
MKRIAVLLIALLSLVLAVTPVFGASIQVTVNTDPPGGNVNGDGCTLREAIENANDNAATHPDCAAGTAGLDTITFQSGITKITLDDTGQTGEIFVDEDLSIVQPIILDGGTVTRIFRIAAGAELTLENITVQNGFTAGAGGTILIDSGALTLLNCNFKDNKAEGTGGAIAMIAPADSALDITNCNFENNTAGTEGGAVHKTTGGTLNILTSRFKDNRADLSGGALAVGGIGTITATAFQDNKAKGDSDNEGGGAIYFSSEATYNIVASGFAGNQATGTDGRGGAIFSAFGTDLAVEYSHFGTTPIPLPAPFDTLTAANETTGSGGMGGAIYNRDRLLVLGSSFIGNKSAQHGGAIASDASVDDDATLANSTFDSNTATGNGGAVYQFGDGREINIINSTITANTANSGSGIYNNEENEGVRLSNTIIASNPNTNCAGTPVFNIIGNVLFGAACPANNALLEGDPKLQALELTFSIPVIVTYSRNIGVDSAASGTGDADVCAFPPILNLDQRAFPRPQGGGNCDAGAVEGASTPGEITVVRPGPENVPDGSSVWFGSTALNAPETIVFTVVNDGQDTLLLGDFDAA